MLQCYKINIKKSNAEVNNLRQNDPEMKAESEEILPADEKNTKKTKRRKEKDEDLPFYSLIGNFIVTFLLTFFILIAIALFALKAMHIETYTVLTGSMSPSYPVNSLVFIHADDPSTIVQGDVITFAVSETACVTHRVVSSDPVNRTFTTKGDANLTNDSEPVLWDNVLGKVVFALPFGGEFFRWITVESNRNKVFMVLGALFVLALISDIIGKIISRRRKKRQTLSAETADTDDDPDTAAAPPTENNANPNEELPTDPAHTEPQK